MSQSKKRRPCPAVGREITAAECGENRQSRYACPESCPYNPFTPHNYTALLDLEGALDNESFARLDRDTPGGVVAAMQAAARKSPTHGTHAFVVWRLFYLRDAAGRTVAERWEQGGFAGWKNDERTLFRAKMRTRVALLEIHRVLDEQRIEVVDLLDPALTPMIVIDRSVAARAVRFASILTWLYPLPHFGRISGTGIQIPDMGGFAPDEIVLAAVRQLGGDPALGEARTRWLAENFARVDDALTAVAHERRRRMMAGLDAQFGAITYELVAPAVKCRAALAKEPAVESDDVSPDERAQGFGHAKVWFDDDAKPLGSEAEGGRLILGRILQGPGRWQIDAIGAARLAELRTRFEARLGDKVKFVKERLDDHGAMMAGQEPASDMSLVPPELLEQVEKVKLQSSRVPNPPPGVAIADYSAQLKHAGRLAAINGTVPVLDGRTMRDAVGDAQLRPRVIALMKMHVRQLDKDNLATGRRDDLNAVIRELGLHEIDFPPPPPRGWMAEAGDLAEGDEFASEAPLHEASFESEWPETPAFDPSRPPAPRLIGPPFSVDEAVARLDEAMKFDTAAEAMDDIARGSEDFMDDMGELTEPLLDDREFELFITFILQIWFALVPRGVRGPVVRRDAMAAEIGSGMEWLRSERALAPAELGKFLAGCRQPALLQVLVDGLMQVAISMPKKQRPSPGGVLGMTVVMRALINELDQALRR